MGIVISGIQQIGIGVSDVYEAFKWYRHNFGMDVCIFEEEATAELMLPYTGGQPRKRHAILVINMQSGGGFEVWKYSERTPEAPKFNIQIGDYGIYAVKIKCRDINTAHDYLKTKNPDLVSIILKDPSDAEYFFIKDPYGNLFQVVKDNYWFKNEKKPTGSVFGCIIGVSDIEKARIVYSDILGYDKIIYDNEKQFEDFSNLPGGKNRLRRVLLKHSKARTGGFSRILGPSQIELVKASGRKPKKIYDGRFWGDLGFMHICYDINGMGALREECRAKGFPFTVDSKDSFDMGEAAGHFAYIEDPDGTLIEFVETHKVPIIKKIGWYLDLTKRNPEKALPDWMVKTLSFNRVKD